MASLIFDGTFHGDEYRDSTTGQMTDPSGHYRKDNLLCFSDSFQLVDSIGGRTGKIAKMVNHYGSAGRCAPTMSDNHNVVQSSKTFRPIDLPNRELWIGYSIYMQSSWYPQAISSTQTYAGLIYSFGAWTIPTTWTVNRTSPQISQLKDGKWLLLYGNNNNVPSTTISNPGENKWLDILVRYKYSSNTNDGITEYWLKKDGGNYVLIGSVTNVNNWNIQSDYSLIRVGSYMDHTTTKNITLYISNVKVGVNRVDVEYEGSNPCPTSICDFTITQ